jgi:hypothetical protein
MPRALFHIVLVLSLSLVLLGLAGCAKSSDNPTASANHVWNISGRTYFVGSTTQVGGVELKCAGMSVTSGVDGSYEFRGVPEGSQTITAEKAGCQTYSQLLDVKSDTRCYVYLLLQTTRLWGYVSNVIDGPVPIAKVTYRGVTTNTDQSGRYELSSLTWSTDTLTVTQPDYLPYRAILNLDLIDQQNDVVLTRERSLVGTITQSTYVDETRPTSVFGTSSLLLLSGNGYDSLGHYVSSNRRMIFIGFLFPDLLRDGRVSMLDASLEILRTDDGRSIEFSTLSVPSDWSASSITFNSHPSFGLGLSSGSIPGRGYWSVLVTAGFDQFLLDWRANRPIYGVQIWGGNPITASFSKQFRLTFKVRY